MGTLKKLISTFRGSDIEEWTASKSVKLTHYLGNLFQLRSCDVTVCKAGPLAQQNETMRTNYFRLVRQYH